MTGFLNDLGLSKARTDPNFLSEGKYPAIVSKLNIKDTQKSGPALIITYKVTHDDPENGGKIKTEFKSLPKMKDDGSGEYADEDAVRNAAFLKQRLLSLGVPENELDNMTQESILGAPVWITVVQTGDYYNIRQVELREDGSYTGQM